MVWVFSKEQERLPGLSAGVGRKRAVERPELLGPTRYHKVDSSSGLNVSSFSRDFSAHCAKRAIRSGSWKR